MAMSVEARALRRSNAVFKSGVDPEYLVTVLYSNFLLTPEERQRATHSYLTANQQLEDLFTTLERRVSANPQDFHELLKVLRNEPAMKAVACTIQGFYDQERDAVTTNGAQTNQVTPTTTTAQNGGRGMGTPTQQELMENVKAADWYPFALNLLDSDDQTVNMIENDSALKRIQDKLREVFRIWLETSERPTWNAVVVALRNVKNIRLARDIENKFC